MVFLSDEDYKALQEMGLGDPSKADELLKKYLTKDEAEGLQSWDKVCL